MDFGKSHVLFNEFTNLGEKLNGDCQGEIMKGILDINEMNHPCNWDGNCRQVTVVYELFSNEAKKFYIVKTQRYFKMKNMEHVHDVWKVI